MKVILSEEQIKRLFSKKVLTEGTEDAADAASDAAASSAASNSVDPLTATTNKMRNMVSVINGGQEVNYSDNDTSNYTENGYEDPMQYGPMAYADRRRQEYNASIGATPSGDYASVPAVQGIIVKPISKHIKRRKKPIRYLVIHYTAGPTSKAGTASNLQNVFNGKRDASADFAVDDGTKVQLNPDPEKYYCWSVGDNGGTHNGDSISIEMCSNRRKNTEAWPNHNGWYFTDATLSNARSLAKELMAKYKIPLSNVVRHFDMTGKLCPGVVGWNTGILYTTSGQKTNQRNNDSEWQKFKASLA